MLGYARSRVAVDGNGGASDVSCNAWQARRRSARTEHLESLPDGLLVEDVVARIGVVAVLDALHVLGDNARR